MVWGWTLLTCHDNVSLCVTSSRSIACYQRELANYVVLVTVVYYLWVSHYRGRLRHVVHQGRERKAQGGRVAEQRLHCRVCQGIWPLHTGQDRPRDGINDIILQLLCQYEPNRQVSAAPRRTRDVGHRRGPRSRRVLDA
jgi:hypothetical protein